MICTIVLAELWVVVEGDGSHILQDVGRMEVLLNSGSRAPYVLCYRLDHTGGDDRH